MVAPDRVGFFFADGGSIVGRLRVLAAGMASGAVGPKMLPGLSTAAARLRAATRLPASTATSASRRASCFVKLRRLRREARHSEISAACA